MTSGAGEKALPGDARHAFQTVVSTQFASFYLQFTTTFHELGHFANQKQALRRCIFCWQDFVEIEFHRKLLWSWRKIERWIMLNSPWVAWVFPSITPTILRLQLGENRVFFRLKARQSKDKATSSRWREKKTYMSQGLNSLYWRWSSNL